MANAPPGLRFQAELANGDCLFRAIARQHYGDPNRFQDVRNDFFNTLMNIVKNAPVPDKVAFWNRYQGDIEDGLLDSLPSDQIVLEADDEYQNLKASFEENSSKRNLYDAMRRKERDSKPPIAHGDWSGDGVPLIYIQLYAYLMKQPAAWGGSFEITVLAKQYNKYIVNYVQAFVADDEAPGNPYAGREVYTPEGVPGEIPPGTQPNRIINLKYNGINHYDSYLPLAGAGAGAVAGAKAPVLKSSPPAPSNAKASYAQRVEQALMKLLEESPKKPSADRYENDKKIFSQQRKAGEFNTRASVEKWIKKNENEKTQNLTKIATRYGIPGGAQSIINTIQGLKSGGGRRTKRALRKRRTQKKR